MKCGYFAFMLVFILTAVSVSAFELRNPERDEPRLRIEIDAVPSPVQQKFDKYVEELAAAAQKDATPEERARKDDAAKQQQAKTLNPIVLFRW